MGTTAIQVSHEVGEYLKARRADPINIIIANFNWEIHTMKMYNWTTLFHKSDKDCQIFTKSLWFRSKLHCETSLFCFSIQPHRQQDQPAPPGFFLIDPRLGAAALRAPAASKENTNPQAILKFEPRNSYEPQLIVIVMLLTSGHLGIRW